MLDVSTECYDPATQTVAPVHAELRWRDRQAWCSRISWSYRSPTDTRCDPRLPYILSDEIPLRPFVRVPFGGT